MKALYFECNMGAAGDMLMAILLELHSNPDDFLNRLNSIGIPGVTVTAEPSVKCGITGTHIKVATNGQKEVQTKFGAVRVKTSHGFGVEKSKPEFEDVAKIAREKNISLQDILKEINII